MEKEFEDTFINFMNEVTEAAIKEGKRRIKNKVLNNNIKCVENLKTEIHKILENKDLFENDDLKTWTGITALLIQSLNGTFSKLMHQQMMEKLEKLKDGE